MTKHNKIMLSMATIAILSGTSAVASELKVDSNELKLDTDKVTITNGVANVTGKTTAIEIKTKIESTIGSDTMTKLNVATSDTVTIGEASQSAAVTIGGTKPADTANTDGYGFDISAKSLTTAGAASSNDTQLNVNADSSITTTDGTTLGENSSINIASGKTLTIGGALDASKGTLTLGGGTLTANGKVTFGDNKLDISKGGTLNFNGVGAENASTIKGAVSSTDGKALNINLGRNSQLTFDTSLELKNASDTALDKITLGGGVLEVKKLIADITNLDTNAGGTINFTGDGSKLSSNPDDTLTLGYGTIFNFKGTAGTEKTTFDNSLTTNGGKLNLDNATMNVKNLTTSANDLTFNAKNGGTIELANGGKSTIKGNLTLGEDANIKILSATGGATAGVLGVDKLSVTKTGKITLGGGVLNVAQGLDIANAGATADSEGNQNNIDISAGGVINFNGGVSNINGTLTTTDNKKLTLDVNQNAGVNFEDLNLKAGSELSLDGGTINVGKLTTAEKGNLSLTKGTLNFNGKLDEKGEMQTQKSSLTGFAESLASSEAIINFNNGSEVSIISAAGTVNLDLSATKANVNFYNGSLVKLGTDSKGTLTAARNLNLGGQVELGTLVAKSSTDSSLLNVGFGTANVSLSGKLVGKDTTSPAKFTIGTDKDGNSIIGASGQKVEIGDTSTNSALTLKAGVVSTNATLTTATESKLIFGGGSLNIGAGGTLTIADTSKNLEFKEGVGGWITLKGQNGSTTGGGQMTISDGALDLSKTSIGIKIENGGKLTTTKASKISGSRNAIWLSDYTVIGIDGDITTANSNGAFEYQKMGDLTLGKDTTLIIKTERNADGDLQEITAGKLTATTGGTATLAFGTGSVNLTGEIQAGTSGSENKLNNQGFASGLTLADNANLDFNRGIVNVGGTLNATTKDKNILKVSGAVANLGALGDKMTKIELSGRGALNIKSDYKPTENTTITTDGYSLINVDGEVSDASKLTFALLNVATGSYTVLTSTKGVTDNAKAQMTTRTSLNDILSKYGLTLEGEDIVKTDNKNKVQDIIIADSTKDADKDKISVKTDGNNIVVTAKSLESGIDTDTARTLKSLKTIKETSGMATDLAALETLSKESSGGGIAESGKTDDFKNATIEKIKAEQKSRESAVNNLSNAQIAQELGGGGLDSQILLSAYGLVEGSGARDSITASQIGIDIVQNGGTGIVTDIKEGASSSSNMSSSTSSVMNTINLSNDMSISGRIAQANNPFASYASFDGLLYAAGMSDLPLYYANNGYMNGFWANAIAGQNKVEGESGTLMGLSVGFDRQLENTLVGFYISYAMAGLNDKVVEQGSDNIQVGVYTSFNQRDIEVNVKAYGQLAVTETTAKRAQGEVEATFNRLYGGISANIGSIFAFNKNSTFIKPYIGENYYYAHTPAYEETSGIALLSVKSANNHALSFDIGVDVRQYWNENSFIYITPSIERYVVNSGGDYTAGFIGSDTTFTIEGKSKTKTYIQTLLGGNISLNEKFNVNVGLGVKKILNGQIERANGDKVDELYLSGNLGLKYRF